ncbi:MAG TPA: hypothetical protein VLL25_01210 [Acidimicrobiales bacterium]|nr:hypothetical protein [Acidimicrobiales bacterium]
MFQLGPGIDLLGCEYLGGCPSLGSRVLNKVELHFDSEGLTVAIAPQGLFTLAAARPVLTMSWPEITVLSATNTHAGRKPLTPSRLARRTFNVLTMRLDFPDHLMIGTPAWTMTLGVRVAANDLTRALRELLGNLDGPTPAVTAS